MRRLRAASRESRLIMLMVFLSRFMVAHQRRLARRAFLANFSWVLRMAVLRLSRAAALKAKSRAIWARTEATSARRLASSEAILRSTALKSTWLTYATVLRPPC